jgi:MoxR-like ATPase
MMKLVVGYPVRSKELEILETHGIRSTFEDLKPVVTGEQVLEMAEVANHVHVAPSIQGYIVDLVEATRRHGELMLGASPRAALHLQRVTRVRAAVDGREYVTPDDIKEVAGTVLEHRMAMRPEAQMRGATISDVLDSVLHHLRVPGIRTTG